MGIGDWGLGIGDWGLGIGPNPQSPIPNPQSPIPIYIKYIICKKLIYQFLNNYYSKLIILDIIYANNSLIIFDNPGSLISKATPF